MKKMCLVMLTAFIIIICVIAFQTYRKSKEEVFDGVFIENIKDEEEKNGGIL